MQRALNLSLLAAGRTSPNPLVGCVIVREGEIVGEGYHQKAGTPHAEVHALQAAGTQAEGADVYVTLEPCSHYGRTPPCADALIQAGVKRVIVAMTDPNPLVSGRGIKKLEEAGIVVDVGLLKEEAAKINEPFLKAISTGMPFVLYKCALTLDGKTAVESGDSKWITSETSRHYVHRLRNEYDVIMTGSQTILHDNPQLTCRGIENGRDPVRLVVDGKLSIPLEARVLNSSSSPCVLATSLAADPAKVRLLKEKQHVEVWQYETDRHVPLQALMKDAAKRGWNSVLLEGGGILAGKMLEEKLIDKIEFMIAPKLAGAGPSPLTGLNLSRMAQAVPIKDITLGNLAGDFHFTGYPDYDSNLK
ncbi:MAG: bifunctional diaminohydroxyphosphoribosylaminopyrimidine deaminase/5-amino-6-(5-phosphoribosylamino)uracil reductase RibD [Peptococcaceae bacterium]|nr:bifunctional diaminohydroxyphosphoribosylaminopyrimidine deaminase/5-amino-6-(5-phosphoribosylamino)uracil reductase RibD [Peptococcaceae bacterium]